MLCCQERIYGKYIVSKVVGRLVSYLNLVRLFVCLLVG